MKATLEDGKVALRGQSGYSFDFPLEDLDGWISFYTKMRDREGGKYAAHYAETVQSLNEIKEEVKKGVGSPG